MKKKLISHFSMADISYCLSTRTSTEINLYATKKFFFQNEDRLKNMEQLFFNNPTMKMEMGLINGDTIRFFNVKEITIRSKQGTSDMCRLVISCRTKNEKNQLLNLLSDNQKLDYPKSKKKGE